MVRLMAARTKLASFGSINAKPVASPMPTKANSPPGPSNSAASKEAARVSAKYRASA